MQIRPWSRIGLRVFLFGSAAGEQNLSLFFAHIVSIGCDFFSILFFFDGLRVCPTVHRLVTLFLWWRILGESLSLCLPIRPSVTYMTVIENIILDEWNNSVSYWILIWHGCCKNQLAQLTFLVFRRRAIRHGTKSMRCPSLTIDQTTLYARILKTHQDRPKTSHKVHKTIIDWLEIARQTARTSGSKSKRRTRIVMFDALISG